MTAQGYALRARIILAAAQGATKVAIARSLNTTRGTVGKWRQRFAAHRLDGLLDEPRPGAPRKIGDAQIEAILARTLETRPPGCDPLEHARRGDRDQALPGPAQRRSEALRLDKGGGRDSGIGRAFLSPNFGLRTLGATSQKRLVRLRRVNEPHHRRNRSMGYPSIICAR